MSVLIGWFLVIHACVGFLTLVVAEYRLVLLFGWERTVFFLAVFYAGLKLITTGAG